jgi:hypothetical protein
MSEANRELSSVELPRSLIFLTAIMCGVLAALALQIYLRRLGYELVSLWQTPQSAKALGPWWGIAGFAFLASGATAAVLGRSPLPWRRFRLLRWLAAAALVFWLAGIDQPPATAAPAADGAHLAASLGALALATLMAMLGGYFTVRR